METRKREGEREEKGKCRKRKIYYGGRMEHITKKVKGLEREK